MADGSACYHSGAELLLFSFLWKTAEKYIGKYAFRADAGT